MARKLCPGCKAVNAGSATQCRCGHVFDASTMVASKPVERCPLCGTVANRLSGAASCSCGYDFDSPPATVRPQIERRKKYGWFWVSVGIFCVVLTGVLLFAQVMIGVVAIRLSLALAIFGAFTLAKGIRTLSWTREVLGNLDAADRKLPAARVASDRS